MLKRHWRAAVLFLALAAILTNPLVLHLWNAVEDKQDALLNTWIMAWVGHASITDPLNLYNANVFYPYPNTLAFSEVLIPQALFALPISLASDNPILGYNLVLVAILWLDGFAMYLLVLDLTGSSEAGWVAGAIYAFNPFNLGNLAQIQLLSLGWLPLAVMFLRRLVNSGKSPSIVRPFQTVFLFTLFFILQALSSIYYALLAGFAVLVYLLWFFLTERMWIERLRQVLAPLLGSSLLIALVLVPLLLPYLSVQRDLGFQRRVEESEPFSASLKQFTEVSPQNVLYGKWLAPNPVKRVGGYALDNLFPGLVAVLLAAIGLLRARPARERGFLLVLLLMAFILSLGPRLYLTSQQATDLVLPYRWLFESFAPMRALRAPVRFEALIMFVLATLAGSGVWALQASANLRTNALAFSLVLLVSAEYLALPAANTTVLAVGSEIPPVYRWLAQQPPGVALELPMMGPNAQGQLDISRQYFTTYHWQKTPDGYSGFVPPRRGEIAYEMNYFPNGRSVSLLQALGVKYLIIHFDERPGIGSTNRQSLPSTPGLSFVTRFGEVEVYRIAPRKFDPGELFARFYLPQQAAAGEAYTAFVILQNVNVFPFAIKPTDPVAFATEWSDGSKARVVTSVPLVVSGAAIVPLTVQAPAREGKYTLRVRSDAQTLGTINLVGEVSVGHERDAEVVIPATLRSSSPLQPEYAPGDAVAVDVAWLVLNKINAYYSVSVRVMDENGNKLAAVDRQPAPPTLLWVPDRIYGDTFELKLPKDLKPGRYRVELLMYQANDQTSVLLLDDHFNPRPVFVLGEFQVK